MRAARVKKVFYISVLTLSATLSLQGCPLIIAGAAGGGALIASDRRTFGAQTEDHEIQIKAAALFSRRLPEAHLNIAVFNRHVLLTGEVPSQSAKQKAETLARSVANVRTIVNELAIQGASSLPSRSNDAYLTAKVKAALIHEPKLSANFLKVVTERGIVYLMGLVTFDEGNLAADVASRAPGVLQVVKVFQYIPLQAAQKRAATIASEAPSNNEATPATSTADVQTGTVSNTSIKAQPLEQQAPAPIKNSNAAQPGNLNKQAD